MNAIRLASTLDMPREEWLAMRRKGIGGSDAGAILGLSPWASPLSVYCDKMGLTPERDDNEAMRQGRDFEEYVAQRFAEATGKAVRRCNFMLQHPEHSFMVANVDRMIVGEDAGLECKTTSVLSKVDYAAGDVPPQYYVQCQHYMAVTGCARWYLAILILNRGFYWFSIERDEREIEALTAAAGDFWRDHVMACVPPAPIGLDADTDALKAAALPIDEGAVAQLYGLEDKLIRIGSLKTGISAMEAQKRLLEQEIQQGMGKAAIGEATGYTVKWGAHKRTGVDTALLKKEFPDVYEQVKKTSDYRMFTIKEVTPK